MCVPFKKTKEVVENYLKERKTFSWKELQKKVKENGGTFYVAPGMTLSQYMQIFEKKGIIYFDESTESFNFIINTSVLIEN